MGTHVAGRGGCCVYLTGRPRGGVSVIGGTGMVRQLGGSSRHVDRGSKTDVIFISAHIQRSAETGGMLKRADSGKVHFLSRFISGRFPELHQI